AGRAEKSGFHLRASEDQEEEQHHERTEDSGVEFHARGKALFSALLNVVERGKTDEPAGAAHLIHDGVAGIDAGGAVHTLHLRAVADVDAGRAHGDTLAAGDAVSESGGGALI